MTEINDPERGELEMRIEDALRRVGDCSKVSLRVDRVEVEGRSRARVRTYLTLGHSSDTPVCGGEPGCYIPFLGVRRTDVPGVVAEVLESPRLPAASMAVHQVYAPGYEYPARSMHEPATART